MSDSEKVASTRFQLSIIYETRSFDCGHCVASRAQRESAERWVDQAAAQWVAGLREWLAGVIRIDEGWLAVDPLCGPRDLGVNAAPPHYACLFANRRAT